MGNGCTKKVCECPSIANDADCDADQEVLSEITTVCGTTRTCKCKVIPDEVCTAPKTLHSVAVAGSTNGCLKKICKCPQCVDPQPCANGLIAEDTVESVCGCTVRKCVQKGCTVETDFTDYISPEDGWLSVDKIEMKRCGGECASKSKWDDLINKYGKNCACCSVASYEDKIISLKNLSTGETKDHTLKVPVLCSCAVTQCLNDEL